MNVEQLRNILRAAAAVTGEKVFVVIGSQAILGSHPDAPRSLRKSIEGDTYPKNNPDKAIEVDGHSVSFPHSTRSLDTMPTVFLRKPPPYPMAGNNGWWNFMSMINLKR